MTPEWLLVPLAELLQPVCRREQVQPTRLYRLLGAHWYAEGLYEKDQKTGAQIQADALNRVECGDFVYNRLFGWKGAFAVARATDSGCYVSSEFPCFEVNRERLNPDYLWRYFSRSTVWHEALGLSTGGTPTSRNRLKEERLLAMRIPLPPQEEQRRIVARIEELAAKVEEARGLRRDAVEHTDAFLSSYISHFPFQEKDWTTVDAAVSKQRGAVRSGPFGSQLHHAEFVPSGIAAIGTRDVQVNRFVLTSGWYVTPGKFGEFRRYQVFPGDVLCTLVGGSIGRFCAVPEDVPVAFTTKHVQALTLDKRVALPTFVSFMLNFHSRSRTGLFSQIEGSAQPSLNASKILATPLVLPPLSEQARIVDALSLVQSQVLALQRLQAETAAELDTLLPSILDRAFTGLL